MRGKNSILILIILALLTSSGILFYRSFSHKGGSASFAPEISENVISIRQEIDAIDVRIKQAMQRIDTGGDLDNLVHSAQFQELVADALRPIQVTETGRANPFVPVPRQEGEVSP